MQLATKTTIDLTTPLSAAERAALHGFETEIFNHAGRIESSGTAIGSALAEIQSGNLWRGTHATFEDYLGAKFDFDKRHAYFLIDFSKTSAALTARQLPPATERRLRLLAPLPLEKRADAYAQAMKRDGGDGVPSVESIEKVVAKLTEAPPAPARQLNQLGHPDYKKDADLANAIERIAGLCPGGSNLRKAIVAGTVPLARKEIITWAAQKDDRVIEVEKLITVNRWGLAEASKFLDKVPDGDTKIGAGINLAIAAGGVSVIENVGGGTSIFFTAEKWRSCRKQILGITEK